MRRRNHNRYNRKQKKHLADLSMTPLIDVALTLLIMFIIAGPVLQNAIKVTLPRGQAQEHTTSSQNELIVYITMQGEMYINGEKTNKIDLIANLKKSIGDNKEKTVFVKADTGVSYGTVLELVDDIKFIGGIHYVALATQKNTHTTPTMA